VYLVSGGTAFPFRLSCSFFLNIQSLPFPFLVIFCFFLGLFLSEMQTCILKVAYIIIISDLKNSNWKEKDTMLQTAQLKLEKKKSKTKQPTVWFSSLLSSSEQLSPSSPFPLGTAVLIDGAPQVSTRYSFLLLALWQKNCLVSEWWNSEEEYETGG